MVGDVTMANSNPDSLRARRAKKRRRRPKPGTIEDLQKVLWNAVATLEERLLDTSDEEDADVAELCKLTHALSQAAGTFLKAVEVGELEARLAALEAAQGTRRAA